MKRRRLTFLLLCLVAMTACADRGAIGFATLNAPNTKVERIFVATTRQRSTSPYDFNRFRTSQLTYARYDISIPPAHKTGRIEWPKPGSRPNPAKDFVTTDAAIYDNSSAFGASVRKSLRNRPIKDEAVVFVHGYNNNFAESLYRFAQITSDMETQSTPVLYAWPSTENTIEYLHDRDSVLFARDGMQTLLEQLANAGTKRIILVAHSIGSNLLMETLRQISLSGDRKTLRLVEAVVLISPDIDQSLFQLQLSRLNPLPEPFIVFSDDSDRALQFMSFLTGKRNRLGQITSSEGLEKYGVQVINLSDFDDGEGILNHSVALTSPSVISIIKKLPTSDELAKAQGGNTGNIISKIFNQQRRKVRP